MHGAPAAWLGDLPVVVALAIPALLAAAVATPLTWAVTRWLVARALLDHPNERSSHAIPTPRGGGWAIIGTTLAGWLILMALTPPQTSLLAPVMLVVTGAAILAVLSWTDDVRSLSPGVRLAVQVLAVAAPLAVLPPGWDILPGILPLMVERVLVAFAWLWFINLFNFMDGIDGLAGVEATTVAIGLAFLFASLLLPVFALASAVVAGAAVGFLVWNWHPARVFMGDVGSIPLGYLLGFLLILAATSDGLAAAILMPLYFLVDATMTLMRRMLRGEKFWRPHRQHFYQRAVQAGRSHAHVAAMVLVCNAFLTVLAWASVMVPALALSAGAIVVALLIWELSWPPRPEIEA